MGSLPRIVGIYVIPPVIILSLLFGTWGYTIGASPVAGTSSSGITATFKVYRPHPVVLTTQPPYVIFFPGIPSELKGGGCFAFPAADLGFTNMAAKSCQKNSDCGIPPSESEYGYCDRSTKHCWAKPHSSPQDNADAAKQNAANPTAPAVDGEFILDHKFCRKSSFTDPPTPWAEDVDNPVSLSATELTQHGVKKGDSVRLIGCLNQKGATTATNCASKDGPDRIQAMGKPALLN